MPTPDPEEQAEALHAAEKELKDAKTADDVRTVWRKHYLAVGHRKLGRLLIGRTADQILAGRQKD
jgi:hypothetical protein